MGEILPEVEGNGHFWLPDIVAKERTHIPKTNYKLFSVAKGRSPEFRNLQVAGLQIPTHLKSQI